MKTLTLQISKAHLDEILSGKRKHHHVDIIPTNVNDLIYYVCEGRKYRPNDTLPEEGELEMQPIAYDAIRFEVGDGKHQTLFAIVEVKAADIYIITDAEGNDVVEEFEGTEFLATQIDYRLGRILEQQG